MANENTAAPQCQGPRNPAVTHSQPAGNEVERSAGGGQAARNVRHSAQVTGLSGLKQAVKRTERCRLVASET